MVSAAIWRMITNRRSEPINFCACYIQIADLNLTPCLTDSQSLIEFFDQENMGLDTKITLLWQLEPKILTKVRLGDGSVERP